MGKTFADPLFIVLAAALAAQILLYKQWRGLSASGRLGLLASSGLLATLWLLGTHGVESALITRLNRAYPAPSPAVLAEVDIVVVLAGGFIPAPTSQYAATASDPIRAPQAGTDASKGPLPSSGGPVYDLPDVWSMARLIQGVRTFLAADARWLVLTGYWSPGPAGTQGAVGRPNPESPLDVTGPPDGSRLVRTMADVAVQLGVPPDRIAVEPLARNTRAHPIEVSSLGIVGPEDTVAVVTSSWHLPRAMAEFQRHFPHVVAVPAFDTPVNEKHGLRRWLPRSRSLAASATAIAEYIGMLLYAFRPM